MLPKGIMGCPGIMGCSAIMHCTRVTMNLPLFIECLLKFYSTGNTAIPMPENILHVVYRLILSPYLSKSGSFSSSHWNHLNTASSHPSILETDYEMVTQWQESI